MYIKIDLKFRKHAKHVYGLGIQFCSITLKHNASGHIIFTYYTVNEAGFVCGHILMPIACVVLGNSEFSTSVESRMICIEPWFVVTCVAKVKGTATEKE